jgi:maleate isomerase
MTGWRARLGFLVPPGNPTVEPEMLAPQGVTVHFSRLVAHGGTGSHAGQEERNLTMVEHVAESAGLLAMVKPDVIMFTHTATSYTLGPQK